MSMKIVRNTPEQLIVSDTPWFTGILLGTITAVLITAGTGDALNGDLEGGLGMALGGGGMFGLGFAVFVQRAQAILNRETNELILRRRTVIRYTETRHALADLSRAVLDTTTDSDGDRLYRPVLMLEGASRGPHPIVAVYTSSGAPQQVVTAINDWLKQALIPQATA